MVAWKRFAALKLSETAQLPLHNCNRCANSNLCILLPTLVPRQDPRLIGNLEALIADATAVGVEGFSVNGTSEDDWEKVTALEGQHPHLVVPNFGLHPWWVGQQSEKWLHKLEDLLRSTPHAGVGECGLDKLRKNADFSAQEEIFRAQLKLAKELARPVSVHCVRAFGDLLETVQTMSPFPAGLILHSWTGPPEMVVPLARVEGVHFSLSGYSTRSNFTKLQQMVKQIPLDRLLLETDAPDGLPKECKIPGRSQQEQPLNCPANIRVVCSSIALAMGIDEITIANAAHHNALRLFRLKH